MALLDKAVKRKAANILADRFVVPPFSVLDTEQRAWKQRKKRWVRLGLKGELGRTGVFANGMDCRRRWECQKVAKQRQLDVWASLFDPVLCECVYSWWCPPGGLVLDPFAGGSVRGVVASIMGRDYVGIDLRPEQIEADYQQGHDLLLSECITDASGLTPVERHGDIWFKRDDLFAVAGVCGGKVRAGYAIFQRAKAAKAKMMITAGARQSPQIMIVASLAAYFGLPCRCHVPDGQDTDEIRWARRWGAEIVKHKPGYNNVIVARAREDAQKTDGGFYVPFGMECDDAVEQAKGQVSNLPFDKIKRIVMAVGSGMTLAGVLWGLKEAKKNIPVVGVVVGADPRPRLGKYAPVGWESQVQLVDCGVPYQQEVVADAPVRLDGIYEAKAWRYVKPGDLFWVVGHHESPCKHFPVWRCGDSAELDNLVKVQADLVFVCPPYGNLEVYSDREQDLSNMEYGDFLRAYQTILSKAFDGLKDDRFTCLVVADFRDKKTGCYYPLTSDTVRICRELGLELYNKAVLKTSLGTVPLRATRIFQAGHKLLKIHQDILVFVKGDWKKAVAACKGGAE